MNYKCNFEYIGKKIVKIIFYNNLYLNLMIKYKKVKIQENGFIGYFKKSNL